MEQINFRVSYAEKEIIKELAAIKGMSIAELMKRSALENLKKERVELAFKIQKEGKLSRKKTLKLSGLGWSEFSFEWAKRGAVEDLPDEIWDRMEKDIKNYSFK